MTYFFRKKHSKIGKAISYIVSFSLLLNTIGQIVLIPVLFLSSPQKAEAATASSGVIVAWPGTHASIPAGWSRVTELDGYYVEGTTTTPTATVGGSATHTHTSPPHSHDISHTHTGTTSGASGGLASQAGITAAADSHAHTITTDANIGSNVATSCNFDEHSNDPPYTEIIWIESNGTAGIPDGAWAMYYSDTLPSSWVRANGNRFLKGAVALGDGGAQAGDSDNHTHTDLGHTHLENPHTHTGTTDPSTGDVTGKNGTGLSMTAHTHTISGGTTTATETEGHGIIANADGQPPFYKLNIIQNNTGSADVPIDTIAIWRGNVSLIPSGWVVCDGSNGTPILTDKFIKGSNADSESGTLGGALTHSHLASTSHSHTINAHTHNFTVDADTGGQRAAFKVGLNASNYSHTHTLSVNDGTKITGTATVTADANVENRPLFKEVIYIQYQPDDVTISSIGTQTASMDITSVDQYVGGAFVMIGQTSGTQTITDVTITETGTVDAQNDLDNIELYYEYDTVAPYNCASVSFSGTSTETQFGSTDTDGFSSANGTSTFSGTATASTTQAVCFYAVLDVTSGASNGENLDIQITDASSDVVLSSGTVAPDTPVAISGSTLLSQDGVVVSSVGTQTASMNIPSVDQYVGGAFAVVGQISGTQTITDVTITETGTVDAQNDLDNIKLYYEYDIFAPYDCASVSYGGAEAPYGSTDTDGFSSANGTSTFSDTATASTTQAVCFYAVLDVTSGASNGETLDIQITNPSTEVVLSVGGASPATSVVISGSTNLNELTTTFTQSGYRIYENVDAIQPTTPLAVENASTSDIVSGQVIRLRTNIFIGDSAFATGSQVFKLQYAEKGGAGSCTAVPSGNFADVGQIASSTIWRGYNNTPADGATTTATLLASSTVNETYEEANPSVSNVHSIPIGGYGEWDWVVRNNGAKSGTTYCFRMTEDDGAVLDTYDNMPEITTRTSATWRELENTPTTVEKNNSVRLRVQVDDQGNTGSSASYRLEFSTSTAGSWTAVPVDAACSSVAEDFRICPSTHYVDLDHTTNRLTVPGGSSFIAGLMLESSNPATSITHSTDEFTELEWHMQATNSATDGETYYFRLTDNGTSIGTYSVFPELTILAATSTLTQNYYRFYVDNDALKPTDPWPAGATDLGENTEITASDTPLDDGDVIRIRMSVQISDRDLATTSQNFKLQFGEKVTTCGAISGANWYSVGAIGSTTALWRATSTTPVDGTALSTDPPAGGDLLLSVSNRAGTFEEENPSAFNPYKVNMTEDVEYDWVVENNSAAAATDYCFRMIKGNDSAFDVYTYYPALVTSGYEVLSQNWRWYDDENNETPSTALEAENTAPIDIDFENSIKLRFTIKETAGAPGNNQKFKVQYSLQSDFSSGVNELAEISNCTATSVWCYADGAGVDNVKISSSTLSDADLCVASVGDGCGTHNELATSTSTFTHPANAASEFEFTLKQSGAQENTVYYFRAYDVTGDQPVGLGGGETYPSLSTKGATLTFVVSGLSSGITTEGVVTDVTTDPTTIPFGSLSFGAETEGAQRLTVTTNAPKGYNIFLYQRQALLGPYSTEIDPITSTNSSPTTWGTACSGLSTGCYGYHTGDDTLSGGSIRFAIDDRYAKLTSTSEEIAYSSAPVVSDVTDIVYKIRVTDEQEAGIYESSLVYIVVPVF